MENLFNNWELLYLVIISLIHITLMCDPGVILYDKIECLSLFQAKGLNNSITDSMEWYKELWKIWDHICQLLQIIPKSPGYRVNLWPSCTDDQNSWNSYSYIGESLIRWVFNQLKSLTDRSTFFLQNYLEGGE